MKIIKNRCFLIELSKNWKIRSTPVGKFLPQTHKYTTMTYRTCHAPDPEKKFNILVLIHRPFVHTCIWFSFILNPVIFEKQQIPTKYLQESNFKDQLIKSISWSQTAAQRKIETRVKISRKYLICTFFNPSNGTCLKYKCAKVSEYKWIITTTIKKQQQQQQQIHFNFYIL